MANNWSSNTPSAATYVIPEIVIPHTQGVATSLCGISTGNLHPYYGMSGDGQGNLLPAFSGQMMTLPFPAELFSLTINTNILMSDMVPGYYQPNYIHCEFGTSFYLTPTTVTTGARASWDFVNDTPQFAQQNPASTLNSPPEVGDTGTLFSYIDPFTYDGQNGLIANFLPISGIGNNGGYSAHWFCPTFNIPASAITKNYKFQITIGYV